MQETQVQFLGQKNPLEKEMATHSSILAWEIQWTEEPGGLQSIGLQRVGHNWATEQAATCSTTYEKGKFGHRCALRSPCDNDSRDQDEAATSQGPKIKQQLEPDMEQWTGSKLGTDYIKSLYCLPA